MARRDEERRRGESNREQSQDISPAFIGDFVQEEEITGAQGTAQAQVAQLSTARREDFPSSLFILPKQSSSTDRPHQESSVGRYLPFFAEHFDRPHSKNVPEKNSSSGFSFHQSRQLFHQQTTTNPHSNEFEFQQCHRYQ